MSRETPVSDELAATILLRQIIHVASRVAIRRALLQMAREGEFGDPILERDLIRALDPQGPERVV